MTVRDLTREEVDLVWTLDRSERIEEVYRLRDGRLELEPVGRELPGWPEGEAELTGPVLLDCFDRGGSFLGAFDGGKLAGVAVLEERFIGPAGDQLQLKFLHVGRPWRGAGLGRRLFGLAAERARGQGARSLYVSSTCSRRTVDFYFRLGCRLARHVDAELFALEPVDIHLDFELPA